MSRTTLSPRTLTLTTLEDRAVPANNLTVVDDLTGSSNIDIQTTGSTVTIRTSGANAEVAIGDIQTELLKPGVTTVVLTTQADIPPNDTNQAGSLEWDEGIVGSPLDLTGLGTGKMLRLETHSSATVGEIKLTDFSVQSFTNDTLSFEFDSSAANGDVSFLTSGFAPVSFNLPGTGGNVAIKAGTGTFNYLGGGFSGSINAGGNLTVGAGALNLVDNNYSIGGTATFTATTISLKDVHVNAGPSVTFNGPVTVNNFGSATTNKFGGTLTYSSTLDGPGTLTLDAGTIAFNGNVGAGTPLGSLVFNGGMVNYGTNAITATTIDVGAGFSTDNTPAIFGNGTGAITANINVNGFGHLNPAGNGIGVLNITGDVIFNGGSYSPDLGTTSDVLNVTGNVDASVGFLGNGVGNGSLATGGTANILTYTGTLTGEFSNAPLNDPVIVGTDAVNVTQYATSPIMITQLPASNLPGTDFDGTGYTVKVTGGGEVVSFLDTTFTPSVVIRNATAKTALTITTKANASDDLVTFNDIVVNGPLAKFAGAKVNIANSLRTSGVLKSATFGFVAGKIEGGGAAADKTTLTGKELFFGTHVKLGSSLTSLKLTGDLGSTVTAANIGIVNARNFFGSLVTSGNLGTIKLTGLFTGQMTANSLTTLDVVGFFGNSTIAGAVKTVKVKESFGGALNAGSIGSVMARDISGAITTTGAVGKVTTKEGYNGTLTAGSLGPVKTDGILSGTWSVLGGITSLTASQVEFVNLSAQFLGSLTVKANPKLATNGGVFGSTFNVLGNNGNAAGAFGLKTVSVGGTIDASFFNIAQGNVASFTAGRFIGSKLHLNYTDDFPFDTAGTFNGGPNFTLGSFKTTATTLGDANHPYNWSFAASQVAAQKIGLVELSGVNTMTGGIAFGIKSEQAGTVVKVKSAGPGTVAPLFPGVLPANFNVDDFFVMDV